MLAEIDRRNDRHRTFACARSGNRSFTALPVRARCSLSSDGVEAPRTHTAARAVGARKNRPCRARVAHAVLLFERRVVLLVDDDETEILHGREECAARTNRDRQLGRPGACATSRDAPSDERCEWSTATSSWRAR